MVAGGEKHDLDEKMKSLNTEMREVLRDSEEFALIQQYVALTHGPTHEQYELSITDLFSIERDGEEQRFKDAGFDKDPNRQLL